jgi:hypothetical protein
MSQLKMLERDQKFNINDFNKKFEESDLININKVINKETKQKFIYKEIEQNIYLFEDFVINIKNLFFKILELLVYFKNPIPYILENNKREFYFAIMLLLIGILLLFFSNLLI